MSHGAEPKFLPIAIPLKRGRSCGVIPVGSFPRSAPNPIGFDILFSCGELAWLSFSYLVNEPRDRSTARMHDCDVIYTDRLVTDRWAYVAHRAFMWRTRRAAIPAILGTASRLHSLADACLPRLTLNRVDFRRVVAINIELATYNRDFQLILRRGLANLFAE